MVFRGRILKITKNLAAVRNFHVATATLAGMYIMIHVSFYTMMPENLGTLLGYSAFAMGGCRLVDGNRFLRKGAIPQETHTLSRMIVLFASYRLLCRSLLGFQSHHRCRES